MDALVLTSVLHSISHSRPTQLNQGLLQGWRLDSVNTLNMTQLIFGAPVTDYSWMRVTRLDAGMGYTYKPAFNK